ncbi:uncharacterized protein LOC110841641 [Folsomia candida]|uniref:DUF243 domain-containing protein n=1 Tax=Folsomia candida TaxID=158441 RepID=A0A226F1V4_FOLCA|nr:uncharacterized protein LOC110841641 [Folsomia candida]OXA63448.1 hypothetical protein Fcan01_01037 [Folsomia candida]
MYKSLKIFILSCLISLSFCGTRPAHPGEEARALALWDRHCSGGKDGGNEGSTFIHCKHPLEVQTKTLISSIQAQNPEQLQREQYIFVDPPKIHFNHELEIRGGAALEPKTVVYVRPAKTSHTYEADLQIPKNEHKKPELVFLSSSGGSGGARGQGVEVAQSSAPLPIVAKAPPVVEENDSDKFSKREAQPVRPVYVRPDSSVVYVTSTESKRVALNGMLSTQGIKS